MQLLGKLKGACCGLAAIFLVCGVCSASSVRLAVPFKAQVPPGSWSKTNNCGQAAVAMVVNFYNGTVPSDTDIQAIDDFLFGTFGDPVNNYNGSDTNISKLAVVARQYAGFQQSFGYTGWSLDDLLQQLQLGHPVIVAVWTKMSVDPKIQRKHFMVLTGMDDAYVYVNDPGRTAGQDNKYPIPQFQQAWATQKNSVVLITRQPSLNFAADPLCAFQSSCAAPQGTTFMFSASGFSPGAAVRRFSVSNAVQTELLPLLYADSNGKASWSFTTTCSTTPGSYTISTRDEATGLSSNALVEIITGGNCVGAAPAISITPSSFDFGTVNVGSSSQKTFIVQNTGTATLTVSGVNISSAGDFDAVFPAPPFNIDPGLTNAFTVFFRPTTTGLRQGTATLTSNASATPTSVPLSGTGASPTSSAGFMKTLGTSGDEFVSSLQKTSDGEFIITGYTNGSGAGGQDMLLIKLDASGTVQWGKTAGASGDDFAFSIGQTSDGGYIVGGSSDAGTGVGQFLLSKFDSTGAFQWARTAGDGYDSGAAFSAQQTTDGGYIATGFPFGAYGLGLLKYDANGTLQWLNQTPGPNHYGISVQQTSDGGYIVAGSIQVGGTQYDASLLKFDSSGNLQWAQQAGGNNSEQGNAVRQTSDGGYIMAGATASAGAGGQDTLLLKYDSTGALQWARTGGGTGDDAADSVQQTADGGYVVSGHTNSFGAQNVLLIKYDGSGGVQWARNGGGSTGSTSVQQTTDGGYLVAASTASFGAGGSDVLLIKTDSNGNIAGCGAWSSVIPSGGTTFPSTSTSYNLGAPPLNLGAPTFTVANAPLISTNICP